MCKMRTPEIDVIRFTESDIVAASGGKFITIADLGDRATVSATFKMGANTWNSKTVVDAQPSGVAEMMDDYSGGQTEGKIYIGEQSVFVFSLALADVVEDDAPSYSVYNGTYVWNGTAFTKQS